METITGTLTAIATLAVFYALFVFTCALDNSCAATFMDPIQ